MNPIKNKDFSYKNIDQLNVHNTFYNPLEIGSQIKFAQLESIDFYHYHASLPIMEKVNPLKFYEASSKMEDSSDLRGYRQHPLLLFMLKKYKASHGNWYYTSSNDQLG